jgi:hypothetical protein
LGPAKNHFQTRLPRHGSQWIGCPQQPFGSNLWRRLLGYDSSESSVADAMILGSHSARVTMTI